tara:strand:+ start:224 stop:646 length:423 start_codon:yes stop_codon:yes gene_type:complete
LKGSKAFGQAVEQLFFARAMLRGLDVFVPLGDYLPQDCLVVNAADKYYRVQVKGTDKPRIRESTRRTTKERWRVTAQCKSKEPLDCTKVDLLAAYVRPMDTWYLIPCLEVSSRCVWLYPNTEDSKAKYEKYKEDWDYFKR